MPFSIPTLLQNRSVASLRILRNANRLDDKLLNVQKPATRRSLLVLELDFIDHIAVWDDLVGRTLLLHATRSCKIPAAGFFLLILEMHFPADAAHIFSRFSSMCLPSVAIKKAAWSHAQN